jgi:hypothetical protein
MEIQNESPKTAKYQYLSERGHPGVTYEMEGSRVLRAEDTEEIPNGSILDVVGSTKSYYILSNGRAIRKSKMFNLDEHKINYDVMAKQTLYPTNISDELIDGYNIRMHPTENSAIIGVIPISNKYMAYANNSTSDAHINVVIEDEAAYTIVDIDPLYLSYSGATVGYIMKDKRIEWRARPFFNKLCSIKTLKYCYYAACIAYGGLFLYKYFSPSPTLSPTDNIRLYNYLLTSRLPSGYTYS